MALHVVWGTAQFGKEGKQFQVVFLALRYTKLSWPGMTPSPMPARAAVASVHSCSSLSEAVSCNLHNRGMQTVRRQTQRLATWVKFEIQLRALKQSGINSGSLQRSSLQIWAYQKKMSRSFSSGNSSLTTRAALALLSCR